MRAGRARLRGRRECALGRPALALGRGAGRRAGGHRPRHRRRRLQGSLRRRATLPRSAHPDPNPHPHPDPHPNPNPTPTPTPTPYPNPTPNPNQACSSPLLEGCSRSGCCCCSPPRACSAGTSRAARRTRPRPARWPRCSTTTTRSRSSEPDLSTGRDRGHLRTGRVEIST